MAPRPPKPEQVEQPPEQSVRDVTPPPAEEPPAPYYIAVEPLFVGDQFSRAFNPGDRVPREHVEAYGWADKVRLPDSPEQQPAAPQTVPETAPGQATTTEKDGA
ncbi:hypothetical protein [Streptosporangium saharense]|uniref:hypothetical protein n=1 Tax=Streptosporangium saharense TaxID=1706840 RepID=UPI0033284F71